VQRKLAEERILSEGEEKNDEEGIEERL